MNAITTRRPTESTSALSSERVTETFESFQRELTDWEKVNRELRELEEYFRQNGERLDRILQGNGERRDCLSCKR